jgi:uncharacterized protein (TIGR00661 family)
MANILYGVNGEGSGHSTRAKEVISHLQARGHRVHVASFDRGLANLRKDFDVTEIFGWRIAYVNNRARLSRTVTKNLWSSRRAGASARKLTALVERAEIHAIITDFEPLSCHVGRRSGLPILAIDNQHILTNTRVAYPKHHRADAAAAKLVTRWMVPGADEYFVTSFVPAVVKRPRTSLFAPILRECVLRAKPSAGEHVLVYVTSPAPALAKLLGSVRCNFIAYGFGREGRDGNIEYRKPSLDRFLSDLVTANAVIANSGFSLVTEALHLGKPYLAIPVKHQYEQDFNAYWVGKLGYGASWDKLNKERAESFLYNRPLYRERLATYPREGNEALFSRIDEWLERAATSMPRRKV